MSLDREKEKEVNKLFPGLLKNLPGDRKAEIIRALQTVSGGDSIKKNPEANGVKTLSMAQKVQSSPVPPPDFLHGYNEAIHEGGNRLFTMVEGQSAHRISMETGTITTQNTATLRGQWMAFGIVLLLCGIGERSLELGHPHLSAVIFGGTIASVAAVFITGKYSMRKNLEQKKPALQQGKKR